MRESVGIEQPSARVRAAVLYATASSRTRLARSPESPTPAPLAGVPRPAWRSDSIVTSLEARHRIEMAAAQLVRLRLVA